MRQKNNIVPQIESVYSNLTQLEQTIADYFISEPADEDLSAQAVCGRLFISEATLTRFSKKCGFKGYREFIFQYGLQTQRTDEPNDLQTRTVLDTYQELLDKSYVLLDEAQMQRVVKLFLQKKRVFVYGIGSSGCLATEMKIRFMRIGIQIYAVTDAHVLKMNSVMTDTDTLVVGLSLGGKTNETLSALEEAKKAGAPTALMTSRNDESLKECADEIMLVPVKENLDFGNAISPQFPVMIMVDILFSKILESDLYRRSAVHSYTLSKILERKE